MRDHKHPRERLSGQKKTNNVKIPRKVFPGMKKAIPVLLAVFLIFLCACAAGEEDTVTLTIRKKSLTVPASSEYVDLGKLSLRARDDEYQKLEEFISALPNLKKLDMYSTDIYRPRIEQLAERFPEIEFGWTMVISCTNYTHPERNAHRIRTDATAFSTLHNKYCTGHTGEDFSILKYCKNLLALDIGHNTTGDLSFLYDLPKLKVLIVAINDSHFSITIFATSPALPAWNTSWT